MYRRIPDTLPKDPKYPSSLKGLGYKIDENDRITSINEPGEYFQFWITNNSRYNDVQREAMHQCIRQEITKRLTDLNVPLHYLPTFSTSPPVEPQPFIPIHCTPLAQLRKKKKIVVIVNRAREDLGVLSYRIISRSGGIDGGSIVGMVKHLHDHAAGVAAERNSNVQDAQFGVVILNPGQLLFSHKGRKAMTPTTWDAQSRQSAVHPAPRISPLWNQVPDHTTHEEHIRSIFQNLLGNKEYVDPEAELFIVGCGEGGDEVVKYLSEVKNAVKGHRRHRVAAIALTAPVPLYGCTSEVSLTKNDDFLKFLAQRAKAWCLSSHDRNTPLKNAMSLPEIREASQGDAALSKEIHLFPKVSGAEEFNEECITTASTKEIVAWFQEVIEADEKGLATGQAYCNKTMNIPEAVQAAATKYEASANTEPAW